MKYGFPILLVLSAAPALADDTRQLGAHEHGVGQLNMAIEGTTVALELHAPGADIVGFEYEATSAEDRAAVDAAVATLARPLELFVFPTAAECSVTEASAKLEIDEAHGDHGHDDHGHDDHAHKQDDHAHDHDHEAHAEEAGHSEFHAEYTLNCANPDALSGISFAYFDTFENAQKLEMQIVSEAGAQALDVTRAAPELNLRGMF
ncbi:zinc uptake protein ZrgA [Roseobacter sp. A03A-229]